MSRTREKLARSYRRLLLCYPRRYRRARGEEIVATFLDLAPPDRTRPTIREAVNLVRNGLRCRLGRPNSRTVVLWATVTTVAWGLFIGAFATRLAWETARPLPTQAEATELFSRVLGQDTTGQVSVDPALFVIYGERLGPDNLHFLFSPEAGEYQQGSAVVSLMGPSDVSHQGLVDSTRAWLRADGWQVSDMIIRKMVQCTNCDESTLPRKALFAARRGDRVLRLEISLGSPREQPPKPGAPDYNDGMYAHVELSRAAPPAVKPFGAAGVALGMLFGWLTFGWASRRAESRSRPLRVLTTVLFGVATFMWWTPLLLGGRFMLTHHPDEPHLSWHPMWEWIGQPTGAPLFVIGTVAALLALAACALPSRNRETATDVRSTA